MSDLQDLMKLLDSQDLNLAGKGMSDQDMQLIKQMGQMLSANLNPQQQELINELVKVLMTSFEQD